MDELKELKSKTQNAPKFPEAYGGECVFGDAKHGIPNECLDGGSKGSCVDVFEQMKANFDSLKSRPTHCGKNEKVETL